MLTTIIGWFWIILGVLFIIKPDFLKKRLVKKGNKRVKRTLFFAALILSFTLIAAALKHQGLLPKIIVILGVIGIIKAVIILKSKASDKLLAWAAGRSLLFYRAGGLAYVIIGVILVKFL